MQDARRSPSHQEYWAAEVEAGSRKVANANDSTDGDCMYSTVARVVK